VGVDVAEYLNPHWRWSSEDAGDCPAVLTPSGYTADRLVRELIALAAARGCLLTRETCDAYDYFRLQVVLGSGSEAVILEWDRSGVSLNGLYGITSATSSPDLPWMKEELAYELNVRTGEEAIHRDLALAYAQVGDDGSSPLSNADLLLAIPPEALRLGLTNALGNMGREKILEYVEGILPGFDLDEAAQLDDDDLCAEVTSAVSDLQSVFRCDDADRLVGALRMYTDAFKVTAVWGAVDSEAVTASLARLTRDEVSVLLNECEPWERELAALMSLDDIVQP
jgi:hypothetical protein